MALAGRRGEVGALDAHRHQVPVLIGAGRCQRRRLDRNAVVVQRLLKPIHFRNTITNICRKDGHFFYLAPCNRQFDRLHRFTINHSKMK